jgi:CheY-like chemotaxis protein/predicted  nucleic acid-binding Zn-ribbon protein
VRRLAAALKAQASLRTPKGQIDPLTPAACRDTVPHWRDSQMSRSSPPPTDDASGSGHGRVLVLETVRADRILLEVLLRNKGYEPILASDAREAHARALDTHLRLAVLDADAKDGFALCLRFKKEAVLRRIPLLLVSGKMTPEVIQKHRLLPTRADGYYLKPIVEETFFKAVAELLPEDFLAPQAAGTGGLADRTLVNPRNRDDAVINYLEDEVRDLKNVVVQLARGGSPARMRSIDSDPHIDLKRRESGPKVLPATPGPTPAPAPAFDPKTVEAARKEGFREGFDQGRLEGSGAGRLIGLTEAEDKARTEIERLHVKIHDLESRIDSGSEVEEIKVLFGRLEVGYKQSITTLDEQRAEAERNVDSLKAEIDRLKAQIADAEKAGTPRLREAEVRASAAEERCAELGRRLQTLQGEVEATREEADGLRKEAGQTAELRARLRDQGAALKQAQAELDTARQEAASSRTEAELLRGRVTRARAILAGEEDASRTGPRTPVPAPEAGSPPS